MRGLRDAHIVPGDLDVQDSKLGTKGLHNQSLRPAGLSELPKALPADRGRWRDILLVARVIR